MSPAIHGFTLPEPGPFGAPITRLRLARDLSGRDLNTTIAVSASGHLIVGHLTSVKHENGYGSDKPLRVWVSLDVDGLRWHGAVEGSADVSADEFPAVTGEQP